VSTDQELLDLQHTLYASRNPTRRWLHCSRRNWIVARLQDTGAMHDRALEVGPGSGIYLPTLTSVASEVIASDSTQLNAS
jgi:hypothetical protein